MEDSGLQVSRKTVLVVLFVPSVERDGITAIDQEYWVGAALETFGLSSEPTWKFLSATGARGPSRRSWPRDWRRVFGIS